MVAAFLSGILGFRKLRVKKAGKAVCFRQTRTMVNVAEGGLGRTSGVIPGQT